MLPPGCRDGKVALLVVALAGEFVQGAWVGPGTQGGLAAWDTAGHSLALPPARALGGVCCAKHAHPPPAPPQAA